LQNPNHKRIKNKDSKLMMGVQDSCRLAIFILKAGSVLLFWASKGLGRATEAYTFI